MLLMDVWACRVCIVDVSGGERRAGHVWFRNVCRVAHGIDSRPVTSACRCPFDRSTTDQCDVRTWELFGVCFGCACGKRHVVVPRYSSSRVLYIYLISYTVSLIINLTVCILFVLLSKMQVYFSLYKSFRSMLYGSVRKKMLQGLRLTG